MVLANGRLGIKVTAAVSAISFVFLASCGGFTNYRSTSGKDSGKQGASDKPGSESPESAKTVLGNGDSGPANGATTGSSGSGSGTGAEGTAGGGAGTGSAGAGSGGTGSGTGGTSVTQSASAAAGSTSANSGTPAATAAPAALIAPPAVNPAPPPPPAPVVPPPVVVAPLNRCAFTVLVNFGVYFIQGPLLGKRSLNFPADGQDFNVLINGLDINDNTPIVWVNGNLTPMPLESIDTAAHTIPLNIDISSMLRGGANDFQGAFYNRYGNEGGMTISVAGEYSTRESCAIPAVLL